jgi:hypothetical protein
LSERKNWKKRERENRRKWEFEKKTGKGEREGKEVKGKKIKFLVAWASINYFALDRILCYFTKFAEKTWRISEVGK